MSSLADVQRAVHRVLVDVPNDVERSSGFCQRRSKLTAALFVQTMVLGFLGAPNASLSMLTQGLAAHGVALSPQGLFHRLGPAAISVLRTVFDAAVAEGIMAQTEVSVALLRRFPAVVVLDSSTITLPDAFAARWAGCGGRVNQGTQAAVKLHVRLDLCRGRLDGPVLTPGRSQDKTSTLQHEPLPVGALRIADLGYWSLPVMRRMQVRGEYFLSRLLTQTHVLTHDGTRITLESWLPVHATTPIERDVLVGAGARFPARLIAEPVPPAVAKQRRDAILADAQREGTIPNARNLALANWTILVTNVPATHLSITEAFALIRARWQIELLFKQWKDQAQLDTWRSHKPDHILCELYAKLIAVVIQHWLVVIGSWQHGDRSLTRITATIRAHIICLWRDLHHPRRFIAALALLRGCLDKAARIAKRRKRPSTAQLLGFSQSKTAHLCLA